MKSIYKKLFPVGLIGLLFTFAPIYQAHAEVLTGITSGIITLASQTILGLFTFIAQAFFVVAGFLLELAMKMNNAILDPNQNGFVFKGWTVFVNVADLALVIGLIVIAFATMLNFESYGMKKNLWRLIVVALLVNFSLVIPGVLIDLSGMVTAFFVNQAGLTGSGMGSSLATAFNISGFMSTTNLTQNGSALGAGAAQLTFGTMNIILNMVFIVVFTAVATVIMLTIAAMFFLRYFMISFLLLMTPVIFVAWIFPGTKKHWTDWWNRFIRWTMFPPVMVFFMWLSLTALNATTAIESTSTGDAGDMAQKLMNFNLSSLIHMAMAVMLMIMSLIAANSISISGAKGSNDMIGSLTTSAQARLNKAGKGAQAYGRREGVRQAQRLARVPAMGAAIGAGAASLRKMEAERKPGFVGWVKGSAAGALGRAGEKVGVAPQNSLKKAYEEKFKGMSDENLAMRYSTMGADEKAFAAQQLIAKGKLSKVNDAILDRDIASKNAKATFDKYGGDGSYDKLTKGAGRNAEMIEAKAKQPEVEQKLRGVEERITKKQEEVDKATGIARVSRTAELAEIKNEKKELEKGSLKAATNKFYEGDPKNNRKGAFSRKDYEALAKGGFFDPKKIIEGSYNKGAMMAMLRNEPAVFASVTRDIEKGSDVKDFMKEVEKMRTEIKTGIMEGIKESMKQEDLVKLTGETNKELSEIMKELKAKPKDKEQYERDTAEIKALEEGGDSAKILKWIEERDAKMFKTIGGASGMATVEDQMHLLHTRNNPVFAQMDQHEDYQRAVRMTDVMRKSAANRLNRERERVAETEVKKPA